MNESCRGRSARSRQPDEPLERRAANEDVAPAHAQSSLPQVARRGDRAARPACELGTLHERVEALGRRLE